jgi:hypothetical protein
LKNPAGRPGLISGSFGYEVRATGMANIRRSEKKTLWMEDREEDENIPVVLFDLPGEARRDKNVGMR